MIQAVGALSQSRIAEKRIHHLDQLVLFYQQLFLRDQRRSSAENHGRNVCDGGI